MTADWSRPPFAVGNDEALVHGAHSPARLDVLAVEIEGHARAAPWWPDHLRDGRFDPEVKAWCRAEAMVQKLWSYLAENDVTGWLTDSASEDSSEEHHDGRSRRRTTSRRVASAMADLNRAENRAAKCRAALALTPVAAGRLGLDVVQAAAIREGALDRLTEAGRRALDGRPDRLNGTDSAGTDVAGEQDRGEPS